MTEYEKPRLLDVEQPLKSCPWCNSTHGTYYEGRQTCTRTEWRVVHDTERCGIRIETEWFPSKAEAVAAWNRRANG